MFKGCIKLCGITGMVFSVVKLHGHGINMGFQCIKGISQFGLE